MSNNNEAEKEEMKMNLMRLRIKIRMKRKTKKTTKVTSNSHHHLSLLETWRNYMASCGSVYSTIAAAYFYGRQKSVAACNYQFVTRIL